jgi:hypothetical protein
MCVFSKKKGGKPDKHGVLPKREHSLQEQCLVTFCVYGLCVNMCQREGDGFFFHVNIYTYYRSSVSSLSVYIDFVLICVYVYICMCVHVHVHVHACVCACVCVCVCIHTCIHTYLHICMQI